MKKIFNSLSALLAVAVLTTGCIDEVLPQQGVASGDQVAAAPGAFQNSVDAMTATMVGQYLFSADNHYNYDIGYPGFIMMRDVMGQDMPLAMDGNDHYTSWYASGTGLGPRYLVCQIPWTYYYKWISNCNIVLKQAGSNPTGAYADGAGIAYALRALYYMDLAQMFQLTYIGHEDAITVPIVTNETADLANNPRAANNVIWPFILSDLDKAEELIANYKRQDKTTPDLSVVYGLKARAHLIMGNWAEAESYAKKAQEGYTPLTEAQFLDHFTGFNTPNDSWMLCVTHKPDDPAILVNDSDSNWASQMCLEMQKTQCGYASSYGAAKRIDAHLYSTIPATDFRRKCWVDPAIDTLPNDAAKFAALAEYSDYIYDEDPSKSIKNTIASAGLDGYAHLSFKFRAGGGAEGRLNQYLGCVVSVPMMRVEEMMLIEAEAAGMQDEARGKQLLEKFAKLRDPQYKYNNLQSLRDNIWWQRRVELWGEGFGALDIKRLNKGIIRSYAGTNHSEGYRWNTTKVPQWMNLCIVETESDNNFGLGPNNPTPVPPSQDSPEYVW